MAATIVGIVAFTWKLSAERETRYRMPDPDRFFPSRCNAPASPLPLSQSTLTPNPVWSKQIIEYENARRAEDAAASK